MKRQAGFTLIEVLVATAIMMIIAGSVYAALTNAIRTTEGVALLADTQENLRAGMNYVVRDIVQAGEGIPQGGIPIPASQHPQAVLFACGLNSVDIPDLLDGAPGHLAGLPAGVACSYPRSGHTRSDRK